MQDFRDIIDPTPDAEDAIEQTLRPQRISDFIGQEKIKDNLNIYISAAVKRREPLDHVLLYGPPGLGKTTLANIIAREMNSNILTSSGPVLDKAGDLAGILTNLNEGDVLFIDEIHRMNAVVEEYLYSAMEDFMLDIMIDKGPNARSVQLTLPKFTLVGATTRAGLLTAPMRARFGISVRLDYYNPDQLAFIIRRSANLLDVPITESGSVELAKRSRGTPRIANRLLRRTRDFAEIRANGEITEDIARESLGLLDVDERGLDDMDKRILKVIIEKYNGGPVGVSTIAVAVGETVEAIEEVYEPYLIMEGFIKRTQRGREVTELTYRHFDLEPPTGRQMTL